MQQHTMHVFAVVFEKEIYSNPRASLSYYDVSRRLKSMQQHTEQKNKALSATNDHLERSYRKLKVDSEVVVLESRAAKDENEV